MEIPDLLLSEDFKLKRLIEQIQQCQKNKIEFLVAQDFIQASPEREKEHSLKEQLFEKIKTYSVEMINEDEIRFFKK